MKPIVEHTTNHSSSIESVQFSIEQEDVAQIFELLRTGIYRDKILAVLREYAANAWDANRMAGKTSTPIEIHIPEYGDQELRIRDFGPGLSPDDIRKVYSKYGRSTKRDTNVAVGSFGIGAKSGFAYADQFTVTSWTPVHDAGNLEMVVDMGPFRTMTAATTTIKRTYVASLDDSGLGKIDLLDESPSEESTGVEVSIAVKYSDIDEFERTAVKLFQHFEPRPTINVELPEPPAERTVLRTGTIAGKGSKWIAVMGCVPYRLDLEQLDRKLVHKALFNLSGSLNLEIGDVTVTASREELRYTDRTKATIVARLEELVDEYVIHACRTLEDPTIAGWDKRLRAQVLKEMGLTIPGEFDDLLGVYAKVEYDPLTSGFTILHNDSHATRITIHPETKLVIDDTGKPIAQYPYLTHHHYIVRANAGADVATLRTMLEAALKASKLDGVEIGLLSEEIHQEPYRKPKKVTNPKHKAKMFRLIDTGGKPYSDNWETVERVPEDTDVYVLIEGFEVNGSGYMYRERRLDQEMAASLGETMPEIYGYKTTEKKPADMSKIKGTAYADWRKAWIAGLAVKYADKIQDEFWCDPTGHRFSITKKSMEEVVNVFGATHPIAMFLLKHSAAKRTPGIERLIDGLDLESSDAGKAWVALQERYPMVFMSVEECRKLWSHYSWEADYRPAWQAYVRMVDEIEVLRAQVALTTVPGDVTEVA